MRIAAVTNFLERYGGAEHLFVNLLIHLKRRGHSVDMFAFDISPEFRRELTRSDIKSKSYGMMHTPLSTMLERPIISVQMFLSTLFLISDMKADTILNKIASEVNSKDYDVVIISHNVYIPRIISKLARPTVYFCHEPPREYYERIPRTRNELRLLYEMVFWLPKNIRKIYRKSKDLSNVKMADLIVTNSNYSKRILYGVYGRKCAVCHPCMDPHIFRKIDMPKQEMILSIGRYFSLVKGHDFVIRCLGRLRDHHPELIIVGRGPEDVKRLLQDLAAQLGVEIKFLTSPSTEELVRLYNTAKITAIAYHREPFGMVAIESMACGTPVVAVGEGGLCESVTRDTGILTARDEKEFADAITRLIGNDELIRKMGDNGIRHVNEHFSYETRVEYLERVLKEVIKKDGAMCKSTR